MTEWKGVCHRCGAKSNVHIMSMYNEQLICMECKDKETKREDYDNAVRADHKEIREGNYNFKGIGMVVWTLKARFSGEEDQVSVYSSEKGAATAMFEFFSDAYAEYNNQQVEDKFEDWLFQNDIGYFDISSHVVGE